MKTTAKNDLLTALDEFQRAWFNLSAAWEEYDNQIETETYPFTESFDEIQIKEWVEEFKERVENDEKYY